MKWKAGKKSTARESCVTKWDGGSDSPRRALATTTLWLMSTLFSPSRCTESFELQHRHTCCTLYCVACRRSFFVVCRSHAIVTGRNTKGQSACFRQTFSIRQPSSSDEEIKKNFQYKLAIHWDELGVNYKVEFHGNRLRVFKCCRYSYSTVSTTHVNDK